MYMYIYMCICVCLYVYISEYPTFQEKKSVICYKFTIHFILCLPIGPYMLATRPFGSVTD